MDLLFIAVIVGFFFRLWLICRENEITHVIFGQSARSRWQIFWEGSITNRFVSEVKDAAVHVIPIEKDN